LLRSNEPLRITDPAAFATWVESKSSPFTRGLPHDQGDQRRSDGRRRSDRGRARGRKNQCAVG
jgi:hypothetical protein